MGRRYSRKSKRIGEAEVMEKSAETTTAATGRKRKTEEQESELAETSVHLKNRRLTVVKPENSASPPVSSEDSTCSDPGTASCCSSNGLGTEITKEVSKMVDLKACVELLPSSAGDSVDLKDSRETTPTSGVRTDSGELESTERQEVMDSRRRQSSASKMPSETEIEEFFAAAEKNLQKEFIEKYNYDIVKDEPLEGRYEWVKVEP